MVEGDGFEPSKAVPADLQSAPFGHSGTPPGVFILRKCFPNTFSKCFSQSIQRLLTKRKSQEEIWWRGTDSNHRRQCRQIYSLLPLATREPLQGIFILRSCFPNSSPKCGANHSKLAQAVKCFSCIYTSNAAFLCKDARKSAFCLSFVQSDLLFSPTIYTT